MVSVGPERPPTWHKSATNDTTATQALPPSAVERALQITKGIGTRECQDFRERHFRLYEPFCLTLASGYARIAREQDHIQANLNLLRLDKKLLIHDFNVASESEAVKDFATALADKVENARVSHADTEALCAGRRLASLYGITTPEPKELGGLISPILERLIDPKWWHKKLQTIQKRRLDEVARDLRTVHAQATPYVSGFGLNYRRKQKRLNADYLCSTFIVNEDGQQFSLKEIADRSVSNPAIRRAELMVRVKGFEMVAKELGHVAEFYTITTPSKMHAQLKSGTRNPKFDGSTPGDAQRYLNHIWKCVRAKLHREGIQVYGFRVVEPHHDGTPHWHLLLFMEPSSRRQVRSILRDYSLKEDRHEAGATKQRFKAETIDPNKGSATGYIAKYIAKNIDGAHLEKDLYGKNATTSAEQIEAWASIHGIRQFQQIGGPSVTVWRELRRLKEENATQLADAYSAADAGDWAAYVMVMGGPTLKRCDRPISPLYEDIPIALPTGELNPEALTRYGDAKKPAIQGLKVESGQVPTRFRRWHVLKTTPAGKVVQPKAVPT